MTLKPLGDKVILKPKEAEQKTKSGILLTSSAQEKPQEAIVVAVNDDEKSAGNEQPHLKEGDQVIYSRYAGTTVTLEKQEYIIVKKSDIIAMVEE